MLSSDCRALGVALLALLVGSVAGAPSKTENIQITFEDPELGQGTRFRKLNGLEFDGFAAVVEPQIARMINYNGDKAAVPAPSGNELQTFSADSKFQSIAPKAVSVGCFVSQALGTIIGTLHLSAVGLDELSNVLRRISGAPSVPISCTIRTRVVGTYPISNLAHLQSANTDYIDCAFKAIALAGQGAATVKACDLTKYNWAGITAPNFTIQSVDLPGADFGTEALLPVIDDFVAVGTLMN